ncbi:hypothetical protein [uncultured Sunxiuqinia sp.]
MLLLTMLVDLNHLLVTPILGQPPQY